MSRENLISLFQEFQKYARDVAVVQRRGYRREAWTYQKLADVAFASAFALKDRGIRTGDRVLIWGPNSAEWMAAFWGCLLRGAVAVPIDEGASADFVDRVAHETSAKFIFSGGEKQQLDSAMPRFKLEELGDIRRGPYPEIARHTTGERQKSMYNGVADEPITRKHIAQILFTSGTTGEPRGVVLTHGNFLANLEPLENGIDPYRKYERWFHPVRFASLVPVSHVFGQFMTLFVPPLLGATVILENSPNPADIPRTIKTERATALIAVPHMLDLLRNFVNRDLESRGQGEWFRRVFRGAEGKKFLRRAWMFRRMHRRFGWKFWAFISGGAALSSETEEFFKRLGYAVVQGYGMTETASLISLNHPFRAAEGSVGKVLPGREFCLAEDGEILVRGENVASGYWQGGSCRSVTGETGEAASERDAWLHTGDLGELDAEGNLRFRGRKKNVIVTPAGMNVYPEDLEAVLRKQTGVRDAVVIPRERGGNAEPFAALLLSNGGESAARRVVEAANHSLAEYQRIHSWILWPEPDFPRTAAGKPRLAAIAARIGNLGGPELGSGANVSRGLSGSRAGSADRLSDLLQRLQASRDGALSLDSELNLSSLDRVELMSALENRYKRELSETAFAEAKTIGDVQRLLREPSLQRSEYSYPRWAQREPVRLLRLAVYYLLVWPATWILGHPKMVGREHLKNLEGPVLVVSNHITRRADIGLILAALPAPFRHRLAIAMGGETLRNMRYPPRNWFFAKRWAYQLGYWLVIALFNVFPLPQFSGFRKSFRYAGESVDRGYSVLVFPEGEVNNSETGDMAPFRVGVGVLAENLGTAIVPMRLDGVWRMKREHRRLAHMGEITVHIGAAMRYPHGTPADEISRQLESLIRNL